MDVKGDDACSLYQNLKAQNPDSDIKWNFAKYLVDGQGKVVKYYAHNVHPSKMMPDIEKLLKQ